MVLEKKSLKFNFVLNMIRVGFNILFPIIVFPYVSQKLGPENLGRVSFSTSVLNYFILIASMGIPTYGVIICAKERNNLETLKKTICELIYISLLLALLTYTVFLGCLFSVDKFQGDMRLFIISSMSILFTGIGLEWLYTALEDFLYITIRSIATKFISLILIFLFVKNTEDYLIYAAIIVFATVGSNILNFIHARRVIRFYKIYDINCKRHWKPILAFFSASVASSITANIDATMLGFSLGDYAVGIYDFSVKIKSFLVSVMTAGLGVMLPRFSGYVAEKKYDKYRHEMRWVYIVSMALACALSFFFCVHSKQVIMILGGEKYIDAQFPMVILTTCILVLGVTWTLGVGVLQPLGKEKEYAKVMIGACALNVLLNAVLIPKLGVSGAAIATFVTETFNMVAFYQYAKVFLDGCLKKSGLTKMMISASIASVLTVYIKDIICFPSLVQLALVFLIFISCYVVVLLAMHKEMRQMMKAILRKTQKISEL